MSNPLFSGKHTEHVAIKPYSVIVVDYHDTQPNFFKIFNNSDSEILCATSQYPTPKSYDFKVKAHAVKGYADIYNRSRLYLYNTSGTEADLTIHSFAGVFDPSAYFLSDFEFTVDTEAETHVNVTGFSQPLPAGSNKIGSVSISGAIPAGTNSIGKVTVGAALPAGSNKIGSVAISGAIPAGSNKIGSVSVDNQNDYSAAIAAILAAVTVKPVTRFGSGSATVTKSATSGYKINELVFISNDSETTDMSITLTNNDGTTQTLTIKAGEVLNNVKVFATAFKITATDAFRYGYNEVTA